MKSLLSLLCATLVTTLVCVQSAAGSATYPKPDAAKKEEPPKIEGMEVARSGGGFLGVAMVGLNFKVSFYDDKKKPVQTDITRALLRWDPKTKSGGWEQAVLNQTSDGKALTGPKVVHSPYNFKLYITLMKQSSDSAEPVVSETYVIDFRV